MRRTFKTNAAILEEHKRNHKDLNKMYKLYMHTYTLKVKSKTTFVTLK